MKIGICGLGIVGNAILDSLLYKEFELSVNLFVYDKYKGCYQFSELFQTDILFLALPTPFNQTTNTYETIEIETTLRELQNHQYNGMILIKSTLLPKTTNRYATQYNLNLIHNPEFLSTKTAADDFLNQHHIVLGPASNCSPQGLNNVIEFYKKYFEADISICTSDESESMKLFLNNFYAVKVQFFTEIYLLCQKLGMDYNFIKQLMIKNGWINQQHTTIPGPDNKISFGGGCFPKDMMALINLFKTEDVQHDVINAAMIERNTMRTDSHNIQ